MSGEMGPSPEEMGLSPEEMGIKPEETEAEEQKEKTKEEEKPKELTAEDLKEELGEKAEDVILLRDKSLDHLSWQASFDAKQSGLSDEAADFLGEDMKILAGKIFNKDKCVTFGKTDDPRGGFFHTSKALHEYCALALDAGIAGLNKIRKDMKTAEKYGQMKTEAGVVDFTNRLEGYFIGSLHSGKPETAMQALEEIARINKTDISEVIERHKDIIENMAQRAQQEDKSVYLPHATKRFLDRAMERHDYRYSQEGKEYVK